MWKGMWKGLRLAAVTVAVFAATSPLVWAESGATPGSAAEMQPAGPGTATTGLAGGTPSAGASASSNDDGSPGRATGGGQLPTCSPGPPYVLRPCVPPKR